MASYFTTTNYTQVGIILKPGICTVCCYESGAYTPPTTRGIADFEDSYLQIYVFTKTYFIVTFLSTYVYE